MFQKHPVWRRNEEISVIIKNPRLNPYWSKSSQGWYGSAANPKERLRAVIECLNHITHFETLDWSLTRRRQNERARREARDRRVLEVKIINIDVIQRQYLTVAKIDFQIWAVLSRRIFKLSARVEKRTYTRARIG